MIRTLTCALAVMLGVVACSDHGTAPPVATDIFNPDHSAARNWNEALLAAIRRDLARPSEMSAWARGLWIRRVLVRAQEGQ
jgi:hypothetical protein